MSVEITVVPPDWALLGVMFLCLYPTADDGKPFLFQTPRGDAVNNNPSRCKMCSGLGAP